jgi:hypothetical protein
MKRHSFALTILLASLATPLITVGSARCQSGAPNYRNQCEVCPLLEDYCNDYDYYYGNAGIAEAQHDELLDPRFDPETGRYLGHDEVKPIETVATESELDEFYAACEDTCNAEVQEAYTSEANVEPTIDAADAARYNQEYYDDYDYNYDYESYEYDYEAEDYWYEESAEETAVEETVEQVQPEQAAEEAYQDSYDYDYGYEEYDNYDYEYETYDYEAYDYEAEVAAEYAAAEEAAAEAIPQPPVVSEEVLKAEDQAAAQAVAEHAWDYEAEGYDPYEYDYEAYEYQYDVYENGAVATPVEVVQQNDELTSEHEADFAKTWTDADDEVNAEEAYSYDYEYDYNYDYDYGVDYEYQPEIATVEEVSGDSISPLASAVSRQALLEAANLLDSLSQVLKNASAGLERTAALDSNLR